MTFKLLIVDDESTMRKGIAEFMNWNSIDCEVAKYVFENYPEKKVILLTGYADFEYAKTAIQYNVSAFILKPTNKKELFEAVQAAQNQLVTSKHTDSIAREKNAFLKEQFLLEMTDHPYQPQFAEKLRQYGLSLQGYYAAASRLIPYHEDIRSLKKIIIDEKKNACCYRYNNLIITIYFYDDPKSILKNCCEIEAITRILDSRKISVGISRFHDTPNSFRQAVTEAIRALTLNFYSENNVSFFSEELNTDCDLTVENSLDLFQFENLLLDWQFGDAETLLMNLFAKFKQNFVNAQDVKTICAQIYYICSRITLKKSGARGFDSEIALSAEYLNTIRQANDIFTLEQAVMEMFRALKRSLQNASGIQGQLAEKAMKYILRSVPGADCGRPAYICLPLKPDL